MPQVFKAVAMISLIAADLNMSSYTPERFDFWVTRDSLEKSPPWDEKNENPPLSARKAIELATKVKDSLVKDKEDEKWQLRTATLEPMHKKWIWVVRFELLPVHGDFQGQPFSLQVPVLMDGSVGELHIREKQEPSRKPKK